MARNVITEEDKRNQRRRYVQTDEEKKIERRERFERKTGKERTDKIQTIQRSHSRRQKQDPQYTGLSKQDQESIKTIQQKRQKQRFLERKRSEINRKNMSLENLIDAIKTKSKDSVSAFIKKNSYALFFLTFCLLLIMMCVTTISSCSALIPENVGVVVVSSFTAEDEEILATEEAYQEMEQELDEMLADIKSDHQGYDEYDIQVDEIGHDPYQLAALLTILHESYTCSQVREELQTIFDKQYVIVLLETEETRYRTEIVMNEKGEEQEISIPYQYRILHVTMENKGINEVVSNWEFTADQSERYQLLQHTKGNKPYLFYDNPYVANNNSYIDYQIPAEALTDENFGKLINEAEKYLGYEYVWGGSSPAEGFDCSGYVSYVLNHCGNGWNIERTTANGLKNHCTMVDRADAKPGDLVFFQGTYSVRGVSHVGIYVGNNMMIHAGSPVSYAPIDSDYWNSHLYGFGRITSNE